MPQEKLMVEHKSAFCKLQYDYRIYPSIMRTFFPLEKLRKLRCVLYTESFVLDSRPSLANVNKHTKLARRNHLLLPDNQRTYISGHILN